MNLVKELTNKDTIWKTIGVIGLILILIKFFLGQNKNLDTGYILFFSFLASACIWLGVYYHRPYPTRGWYMLAFGQFFNSIGNIFFCIYFYQGGAEVKSDL